MNRWTIGGPLVPAGLFIGMGIGWAVGHLVAGLFIGLGAGFVLLVLAAAWRPPDGTPSTRHG